MTITLGILGFLLGGGAGALIAYLWTDRRCRSEIAALQTSSGVATQRATDLAHQLSLEKSATDDARARLLSAEKNQSALQAQLAAAQQNLVEQKKLLDDAQVQLRDAFAAVSADALAKNNEAFLELAKQKFATLSTEPTGSLEQKKAQIEGLLK